MIRTIDYLIQMKETFEYIRVLARTARLGFFGGQKAHSSSVFCDNVFFCAKEHEEREKERERRRRKEFLEQKRLFILTEFNNPKSYGNQIGYHMKCRHSLPEKNSFTSPFETP